MLLLLLLLVVVALAAWPADPLDLPDVFTEQGGYATGGVFNATRAAVRSIASCLGLNPQGAEATVAARLLAQETRLDALENGSGAGNLPAGTLTAKVTAYHSNTVALPTTGDWFGIDFATEPTKVFPYGVRTFTDIDGRVVNGWVFDGWKLPTPYVPRWVRVKAGLALPFAIADWGTTGVAVFDSGGAMSAKSEGAFAESTLLKVDGSLWVQGVDSDSARKWWYREVTAAYYLAEPRQAFGAVRFLHTVGQANINGAEAALNPETCGRGTFVQVHELAEE